MEIGKELCVAYQVKTHQFLREDGNERSLLLWLITDLTLIWYVSGVNSMRNGRTIAEEDYRTFIEDFGMRPDIFGQFT